MKLKSINCFLCFFWVPSLSIFSQTDPQNSLDLINRMQKLRINTCTWIHNLRQSQFSPLP